MMVRGRNELRPYETTCEHTSRRGSIHRTLLDSQTFNVGIHRVRD
jgi:hypothetical protein